MIRSRKFLILALIIPVFALALLAGYKKYVLSFGTEVILPIQGYDPRDLLSGHYLIYQVDYGVEDLCAAGIAADGYVCLQPKGFSYDRPDECPLMIRGECRLNRFTAGIEKYYVPEDQAAALESRVRDHKASIVLSVTKDGRAQVKELLINGEPWKKSP